MTKKPKVEPISQPASSIIFQVHRAGLLGRSRGSPDLPRPHPHLQDQVRRRRPDHPRPRLPQVGLPRRPLHRGPLLARPAAQDGRHFPSTATAGSVHKQTMTYIPAAQLKIQKSATSHEFSKQTILLTFSSSKKLYCCWIGEAMTWPIFPAGSSIQQRSWHSSNRNSSKTKCYLHALHFSSLLHG